MFVRSGEETFKGLLKEFLLVIDTRTYILYNGDNKHTFYLEVLSMLYENENARLLAEPFIGFYSISPKEEISEAMALSMYLYATNGEYYTDRNGITYRPEVLPAC